MWWAVPLPGKSPVLGQADSRQAGLGRVSSRTLGSVSIPGRHINGLHFYGVKPNSNSRLQKAEK